MLCYFAAVFYLGAAFQEVITGTEWDTPDKGFRSLLTAVGMLALGYLFTH